MNLFCSRKYVQILLLLTLFTSFSIFRCTFFSENKKLERIADDFLTWYMETYPIEATLIGIHTYDDRLDDYQRNRLDEIHRQLRTYFDKIILINYGSLTQKNKANYLILLKKIKLKQFEIITWERHQHDALFYLHKLYDAINGLTSNLPDSVSHREINLSKRLKRAPSFLAIARENLTTVPSINLDCTIDQIETLHKFVAFQLTNKLKIEGSLLDSLNYYSDIAVDSIKDFQDFLLTHKTNQEAEPIIFTKQKYEIYLGRLLNDKVKLDPLIEKLEKDCADLVDQIVKIATLYLSENGKSVGYLRPQTIIQILDDEINKEFPRKDRIIPFCYYIHETIQRFIDEIANLSLPVDYAIEFEWAKTPGLRNMTNLIFSDPIGLFEEHRTYTYQLKTISDDLAWVEQAALLRKYNKTALSVALLTDALPIPFHYWKKDLDNNIPLTARAFPDQVFIQGWKYYFALSLVDMGYGGYDAKLKFELLKNYARICFYALAELKYYSQQLSQQQLETLFVNSELFGKNEAARALKQIVCLPGKNLLVYRGVNELIELEKECRKQQKMNFSKKNFLRLLLSQGPIPLKIIKQNIRQSFQQD